MDKSDLEYIGEEAAALGVDGIKITGRSAKKEAEQEKAETVGAAAEKAQTGDPVNAVTGEVLFNQTDFSLRWRIPLIWSRHYGSRCDHTGLTGNGWQSPADIRLELGKNGFIRFYDGTPNIRIFDKFPWEGPVPEVSDGSMLYGNDTQFWVRLKSGLVYYFERPIVYTNRFNVERIADPCGNTLTFSREGWALIRIFDNSGNYLDIEVKNDRIRSLWFRTGDERRLLSSYEYDAHGNLTAALDALGNPHRYFYENGLLIRHMDRNRFSFHYTYDQYNKEGKCIETTGDGGIFHYRFDYREKETLVTDSLGHERTIGFNESNLITRITDQEGGVTAYDYDDTGRHIGVTDPNGHRTEYDYDMRGNLSVIKRADNSFILLNYTAASKLDTIIDPNGNARIFEWNDLGLLVRTISPTGGITSYFYDDKGDLTAIRNPLGAEMKFDRNEKGHMVAIKDPFENTTVFESDSLGNITAITDPENNTTRYAYDLKSRLVNVFYPNGHGISAEYDAKDRPIRLINELKNITHLEYTPTGMLTRHTAADGTIIHYGYDKEARLISVTNQKGETYYLNRDKAGRVVEEIDYWGVSRQAKLDPGGYPVEVYTPLGLVKHEFDSIGRLIRKIFEDGSAESFKYDRNGNIIAYENRYSEAAIQYDPENRPILETRGEFQLRNVYDLLSNRVLRSSSNGNEVVYKYDQAGRFEGLMINGRKTLNIKRRPSGAVVEEIIEGKIKRTYEYDNTYRLTSQHVLAKHLDIKREYAYNAVNSLIHKVDTMGQEEFYTYDPVGKITTRLNPEKVIEELHYDPAGNLLEHRDAPHALAGIRPFVHRDVHYGFDSAGNLTKRTGRKRILTFEWDMAGRLIKAKSANDQRTEMAYDVFHRRISKTSNGATTLFAWDGPQLLSEKKGDEVREYVYYPLSFQPIAVIDNNKSILYFHNDQIGTPQELTDANGNVLWLGRYTAHGKVETPLKAEVKNTLRFQGQYFDVEIGLHYNYFRYYDPDTGRYISPDSIGLLGGINLYCYTGNNPVNFVDPWGLKVWTNEDMDKLEGIMSQWESANTPYATVGTAYAGAHAKKGKGADCSGSMYATIAEAGFEIKYFPTAKLKQAGNNPDVDKYYKIREGDPQRGDLLVFNGHVVYFLSKNENGQNVVYGAHYTGGPNFDKHIYSNNNPVKILYYDGP